MAIWGLIVASLLIIGSLPFFVGLAVVVPVLGHSTWHLYRKVVEPDPSARHEHLPWLCYFRYFIFVSHHDRGVQCPEPTLNASLGVSATASPQLRICSGGFR
jgi:hypothetical protein